jgi:hypothetical protein
MEGKSEHEKERYNEYAMPCPAGLQVRRQEHLDIDYRKDGINKSDGRVKAVGSRSLVKAINHDGTFETYERCYEKNYCNEIHLASV